MRVANSKVLNWGDSFEFPQLSPNMQAPNIISNPQKKYNQQNTTDQVTNSQSSNNQSQNLASPKPYHSNKQINQSLSLINLNTKNLFTPNHKNVAQTLKDVESVSSLDTFQHSKSPLQKEKNSLETKKEVLQESKEISRLLNPKKYNNYITFSNYNINVRTEKKQDKYKQFDIDRRFQQKNSIQISLMERNSETNQDLVTVSKLDNFSEQKSKRIWSPNSYTNCASNNSPQKIDRVNFESQRLNLQPKTTKKVISSAEISKIHSHYLKSQNLIKKTKRNYIFPKKQGSGQAINNPGSLKPVPTFLNKKKTKIIKKSLPINQIVKLNVLTNSSEPVVASLHILKLLAENETTAAYLVRQVNTNFLFCLKKCFIRNDPKQFQLLMREGKFGAKLNHPSLLKTYCTMYDKENVYQLMQYMEGSTLFQKTHEQRCNLTKRKSSKSSAYQIKLRSIKLIMTSLLEAIVYMHSEGIIHRDIKPSNIFIAYDNTLKIGDFGSCGFSGSRDYVGTLDYVTPEVLLRRRYDSKVDVWSVGCIGYELWAGTPPFYHSQRQTTINNIIEKDFDKTKIENPNLLNLLTKLLHKDSSKRITAEEALEHPFLRSPQQNQ